MASQHAQHKSGGRPQPQQFAAPQAAQKQPQKGQPQAAQKQQALNKAKARQPAAGPAMSRESLARKLAVHHQALAAQLQGMQHVKVKRNTTNGPRRGQSYAEFRNGKGFKVHVYANGQRETLKPWAPWKA